MIVRKLITILVVLLVCISFCLYCIYVSNITSYTIAGVVLNKETHNNAFYIKVKQNGVKRNFYKKIIVSNENVWNLIE